MNQAFWTLIIHGKYFWNLMDLMIFSIKFKMKVIMHYMTLSVYRLMSNRFLFPLMSEHFATV